MTHIFLWFAIGTAYLLSMVLICRCMTIGDRKRVNISPSPVNRRRWTERTLTTPETFYGASKIQG